MLPDGKENEKERGLPAVRSQATPPTGDRKGYMMQVLPLNTV